MSDALVPECPVWCAGVHDLSLAEPPERVIIHHLELLDGHRLEQVQTAEGVVVDLRVGDADPIPLGEDPVAFLAELIRAACSARGEIRHYASSSAPAT